MSHSTPSEPIERGWDEPWYRVRMADFQASFLPSDGEDLDEVCNVDVFVTLKDGSRWTATVFSVAEVERLMKKALSRCWGCGCLTVCRGVVGPGSGPVLRPWQVGP